MTKKETVTNIQQLKLELENLKLEILTKREKNTSLLKLKRREIARAYTKQNEKTGVKDDN